MEGIRRFINRSDSLNSKSHARIGGALRLVKHNKRRVIIGFRTMMSTVVCLVISYYYEWSGVGTFLSGVISAITGIYLYFGQWQLDSWKLVWSVIIGSCFGVLAGICKDIPPILIIIQFIGVTFVNRCSVWTHAPKVYSTLVIVLGTLWPFLPIYQSSSLRLFWMLLLLVYVPFLITGILLIVPYPSLAVFKVNTYIDDITNSAIDVLETLIKSFIRNDAKSTTTTMYERMHQMLLKDIVELRKIYPFVEYEGILHPQIKVKAEAVRIYLEIVTALSHELEGMHYMLVNIQRNKTQEIFAEALKLDLEQIFREISSLLQLINRYFNDECYENISYSRSFTRDGSNIWKRFSSGFCRWSRSCLKIYSICNKSNENEERRGSPKSSDRKLDNGRSFGFGVEMSDIYTQSSRLSPDWQAESIKSIHLSWKAIVKTFAVTRKEYLSTQLKFHREIEKTLSEEKDNFEVSENPKNMFENSMKYFHPKSVYANKLMNESFVEKKQAEITMPFEENVSLRNLSPRCAFIHRIGQVVDTVTELHRIFEIKREPWSVIDFSYRSVLYGYIYTKDGLKDLSILLKMLQIDGREILRALFQSPCYGFKLKELKINHKYWLDGLEVWVQPMKIALSVVLASQLVAIQQSRENILNAIWAPITISWIRQDLSFSSFLFGYQRIEGTVIGAIFAFGAYQALGCPNQVCQDPLYVIPIVSIWLGFCALFREGARHGYSALVAGLSPIVLLLGPSTGSISGAWSRVNMTFAGVFIFLFVDHFVLPNRTDRNIRKLTLSAINTTGTIISESLAAARMLTDSQIKVSVNELSRNLERSLSLASHRRLYPHDDTPPTIDTDEQPATIVPSFASEASPDEVLEAGLLNAVNVSMPTEMTKENTQNVTEEDEKEIYAPAIEPSRQHLTTVLKNIEALEKNLAKQEIYLSLVDYDPAILSLPFPSSAYNQLMMKLKGLLSSGRSLWNGVRNLGDTFEAMMATNIHRMSVSPRSKGILDKLKDRSMSIMSYGQEEMDFQIRIYSYFNNRLYSIISNVVTSLTYTEYMVKRLFLESDYSVSIEPLLLVKANFKRIIREVDEHFLREYLTSAIGDHVDIKLILAWMNVFESVCELIKDISLVGEALEVIHIVEALDS